jgi:chromosome partitioning protein
MAQMTGRIIAVANQKGGAGKTTVAVNLAAMLGSMGQRVLLIDVDPQADATDLTGSTSLPQATIYNVLDKLAETRSTAAEAIVPTALAGVELLPGDERLAATEKHLAGDAFAATVLARALTPELRDRYDSVILDCPPNLGLITINAIVAADDVLCVVSMVDRNAYKGAIRLRDTVDELNAAGGHTRFVGIVRNHVDQRLQVYKLISAALADDPSLPLLETEIPKGAKFQTATAIGQPLTTWQPENFGSYAIRRLAEEILAAEVPA